VATATNKLRIKGGYMAIKKKYVDSIVVGGTPEDNLTKAMRSLEKAGFKKIKHETPMLRVRGDWKPLVGTLFGDITLDFNKQDTNTQVEITIVAAVDNAYALVNSPGERLKKKFLEEFSQVSITPNSEESDDVASKLARLDKLREQGHISESEFQQARLNIISGV
jgi:hypothetical protein